jgi:hypothetical protein
MQIGLNVAFDRAAQRDRADHIKALCERLCPAYIRSPLLAGYKQYAYLIDLLEAVRAVRGEYPTLILIGKADAADPAQIDAGRFEVAMDHVGYCPAIFSGDNEPTISTAADAEALAARTAHLVEVAAVHGVRTLSPGINWQQVAKGLSFKLWPTDYADVRLYPARLGAASSMLTTRIGRMATLYEGPPPPFIVTEFNGGETVDDGHGKAPITEVEQQGRVIDCLIAMSRPDVVAGCFFEAIDEGVAAGTNTRNWGALREDGTDKVVVDALLYHDEDDL